MDLTAHWVGIAAIAAFVAAYSLVITEEFTNLRKSKPVMLAAGVGGTLLSIGSAAGIALMGQARGHYTFFTHLRWTPAIALGYSLSIWLHLVVNAHLENVLPHTMR